MKFTDADGITTKFHWTAHEDKLIIERSQDIEQALKALHEMKAETPSWRPYAKGDLHHVAWIPNIVIEDYRKRGIDLLTDTKALRRFLNDPDNAVFRTRQGRL